MHMWPSFVDQAQSVLRSTAQAISFAPSLAVALVVLLMALGAAWALHSAILALLRQLCRTRRPYLQSVLDQTRVPTLFGVLLIAAAIALPAAPLGTDTKALIARLFGLAVIVLMGWIAVTALRIAADLYLRRFHTDSDDNLLARKHVTQVRVLERVVEVLIALLTLGFALMTFREVRQFGVTLFASAGVAGIVAGLAARPVMSNFLAGVQMAISQPIRIDDAVVVENEWGNVEEITFSYVVIRLWDLRRLIVPIGYFLEKPFENWSRLNGELIGTVLLYLDHTTPVAAVRRELDAIVAQSRLWNRKVVNLQVVDCTETTIQLRALVSANTAAATWDLRCEVREKLIAFLQREFPYALPRRRNEVIDVAARGGEPLARTKGAVDQGF